MGMLLKVEPALQCITCGHMTHEADAQRVTDGRYVITPVCVVCGGRSVAPQNPHILPIKDFVVDGVISSLLEQSVSDDLETRHRFLRLTEMVLEAIEQLHNRRVLNRVRSAPEQQRELIYEALAYLEEHNMNSRKILKALYR